MKIKITPAPLGGSVNAPPSKSHAIRLLLCAALSDSPSAISCGRVSEDIAAAVRCIDGLFAETEYSEGSFQITPRPDRAPKTEALIDCGESAATFRIILPAACAYGKSCSFRLRGRLPQRPAEPLYNALENHGITITGKNTDTIGISGRLESGDFHVPGSISSQFISGLIFALPLLEGDSRIIISGNLQSSGYIKMTADAVRSSGIILSFKDNIIEIPGNQKYSCPSASAVEGDWSGSAFWLAAAALSGKTVECTGLSYITDQSDRRICELLSKYGCRTETGKTGVKAFPPVPETDNADIITDVSDIPDLVSVIAASACGFERKTVIKNGARLRFKESDRIASTVSVLKALGADAEELEDGLVINGKGRLDGGTADSFGDHRIAMMAAVLSSICRKPVVINNAGVINKSYPGFFEDMKSLGGSIEIQEV